MASTVGTIMALLVFLTFLSLIVNQYVPVWMKDSEASHMNSAVGQFADVKGAVDFQVLGALLAHNAGAIFIPSTTSTSVTLGVDGVPIFSSPTNGVLSSFPDAGTWNVSFTYCISVNSVCTYSTVAQNASGQIDLAVNNRYFTTGDVVYENGAVIRAQPDGQIIRAAPIFQAAASAQNLSIAFELVNLYGAGSTAGTSTQIVDTNVFGVNQQQYSGLSRDLYVNHSSAYGLAWYNFFNTTLSSALKIGGHYTYTSAAGLTLVKAQLLGIDGNYHDAYWLKMIFNPSTSMYAISLRVLVTPYYRLAFTLQQAYVNVGVGQTSNIG